MISPDDLDDVVYRVHVLAADLQPPEQVTLCVMQRVGGEVGGAQWTPALDTLGAVIILIHETWDLREEQERSPGHHRDTPHTQGDPGQCWGPTPDSPL